MYYFASDMHLGLLPAQESREREKLLIGWLRRVAADAEAIFLVGDLFDFWYEYRRVVPKGFTRLLGTLSELTDRGVEIHFFTGNHDMWAYGYLQTECGVHVHDKPLETLLYGKRFFITHGDDITAREHGFPTRLMNRTFRSPAVRWLFSHLLHPDTALRFGYGWSSHSRKSKAVTHRLPKRNRWCASPAATVPMNRSITSYSATTTVPKSIRWATAPPPYSSANG